MIVLVMNGSLLEPRMGGRWFCYVLCVFSLLSDLMYLLLQALLTPFLTTPSASASASACVVGFSGVLFALGTLRYHYDPDGVTTLLVVTVPNRYAVWAELVLGYVVLGASWMGHLAGIFVGLLYTRGPLETIMKMSAGLASSVGVYTRRLHRFIAGKVFGVRFWAGEEVKLNELRGSRLKRFEDVSN
ncbi:rhomboid-related protein 4-like [Halichoeres trimaculatus]|uniref:rhomboid-related protein 4-like n=1 Tax=Halichoeres trimaculatus TaxID=147232 RepID=UPI003D9DB423